MIHPVLRGWEADPLDEQLGEDIVPAAVAAACLLVNRQVFRQIGGFVHGYVYGAEDVDLSLAMRTRGWPVLCCGRSVVIHHPASTRRTAPFKEERARKLANRRLLWERWGPTLRRGYELGQALEGDVDPGSMIRQPLSYCLKGGSHSSRWEEVAARQHLNELYTALCARDRRCLQLLGDEVEDPRGLNYDVAIHLRGAGRHIPKPAQLNVLWVVGNHGELTAIECARYDLVATEDEILTRRLREAGLSVAVRALLKGDKTSRLVGSLIDAVEAHADEVNLLAALPPLASAATERR